MEHWYVACSTRGLQKPVQIRILEQSLSLFRDDERRVVALGAPELGGWLYGGAGQVLGDPTMQGGPHAQPARRYVVREHQGYVYVALGDDEPAHDPFELPKMPGKIRLLKRFRGEPPAWSWSRLFLSPPRRDTEPRVVAPNVTWETYESGRRVLHVVSQYVKEGDGYTRMHTDLRFDYGIWTAPARPFVEWSAKRILANAKI